MSRPKLTPPADIRQAVRDLCAGCLALDPIEDHWACYFKVRDHLGLTRSTRSRDIAIVANDFRKMKEENKK